MSQPAPAPGGDTARIADLTYRNYDGPLRTRALRWWSVALAVLRTNGRKVGYWILVGIAFLIHLLHGLVAFLTKNVGAMQGGALNNMVFTGHNSLYADTLASALWWMNLFPTFLIAMVVGAGCIAADNRANALLVYLSKPLTKVDYLVGKWIGVFILIGAVPLAYALMLYTFFWTTYASDGFLRDNPTLLLRIFPATLIPAAIHASLIVGFSAWTRSPALAGASHAGLFTVTGAAISLTIGRVLFMQALNDEDMDKGSRAAISRAVTITGMSVGGVSNAMSCLIYDVDPNYVRGIPPPQIRRRAAPPSALPLALLAGGLIVVPLGAAYAKVRAVEVVSG